MAMLDRDGVGIYYEVHGPATAPVLLLSHGYSATSQMWRGQLGALADWRVVIWDMRGHGRSDSPTDPAQYSEAHTVADMNALLDVVDATKAVIAGLSLGGYISLAFHHRTSARTRALMLFDTGPGYRSDDGRAGWNRTAAARAAALEAQGLAALGGSAEVRAATHRSAQGLAHAARGMLAQRDSSVIDSLPRIAVPTLVLVGELDTPFLAGSDYMARKIPGAAKVVLAGAGHAANIDRPTEFNAEMLAFLGGLPAL